MEGGKLLVAPKHAVDRWMDALESEFLIDWGSRFRLKAKLEEKVESGVVVSARTRRRIVSRRRVEGLSVVGVGEV